MEKKTTEVALEKLGGPVLRGTSGAVKSTLTAALRTFLGIGPLKNSISVPAAKAYYRIEHAHGIRRTKESGPRDLFLARNIRLAYPVKRNG